MRYLNYEICKSTTFFFRQVLTSESAIQSKSDEHQEENDCPEHGAGHGGDGFRVHDEHKPWTFEADLLDAFVLNVSHVSGRNNKFYGTARKQLKIPYLSIIPIQAIEYKYYNTIFKKQKKIKIGFKST